MGGLRPAGPCEQPHQRFRCGWHAQHAWPRSSKTNFIYAGIGENLALARAPGYLDTPKGRVGFISVSSSFPSPIIAGPQRKDMRGRPGLNPLRSSVTYTVPQATFDTLKALRGNPANNMGEGGGGGGGSDKSISWGGATYVVGDKLEQHSKANAQDHEGASRRACEDADQQADWVVVTLHSHEAAGPGFA